MTTLRLVPGGRTAAPPRDVFEVAYSTLDGDEHRVELSRAWDVPFESGSPVRRFKWCRGSGTSRAGGGRQRWAAMSATNRGWSAIT